MAQVAVQQPQGLGELFSAGGPLAWDISNQQINDQTLGNLINRQQAQQSMDFAAQEQPFKLDQLGLANQTTRAQLPGIQADSGLKQNTLKVDNANLDIRTKADAARKLADISEAEWTQHMNAIQQAMVDPSPQVRNVAQQLYAQLPDLVKMRQHELERRQTEMDVEDLRGSNARSLENQQYEHGKYLKPFSAGIDVQIRAAKNPEEKMLKIQQAYQEAKDEAAKQHYQDLYDAVKPLYDNYMAAKTAQNAGKVNAAEAVGMPAVQAPTAPNQPGKPVQEETPDKLQLGPQDQKALQWARSNPNDPRSKLILQKLGLSK